MALLFVSDDATECFAFETCEHRVGRTNAGMFDALVQQRYDLMRLPESQQRIPVKAVVERHACIWYQRRFDQRKDIL